MKEAVVYLGGPHHGRIDDPRDAWQSIVVRRVHPDEEQITLDDDPPVSVRYQQGMYQHTGVRVQLVSDDGGRTREALLYVWGGWK